MILYIDNKQRAVFNNQGEVGIPVGHGQKCNTGVGMVDEFCVSESWFPDPLDHNVQIRTQGFKATATPRDGWECRIEFGYVPHFSASDVISPNDPRYTALITSTNNVLNVSEQVFRAALRPTNGRYGAIFIKFKFSKGSGKLIYDNEHEHHYLYRGAQSGLLLRDK